MKDAARYYMIGGFLGAGKTTAVAALAQHLTQRGARVGLITNDQGSELVDTAMLRARGFTTEEIPGGCFCCRFNSLVDAAHKLTAATRPDAFVAEPVGSCTDLVATVSYPLRRIYGNEFRLAPLSVLVDPARAEQVLGLREGRKFSDKVLYIWRKQVEEADLIVIAKGDLLDEARLSQLRDRLDAEFPGKRIMAISARTGTGLTEWFEFLETAEARLGDAMTVDYDTYAEGEALLGWLNATADLTTSEELDSGALLEALARQMQQELAASEIAHLKMTFSPDDGLGGEVAALSLVRSDFVPELSLRLEDPVRNGQLIVNCRAETDPAELRRALEAGLAALPDDFAGLTVKLVHAEHFRPGRPQPTHRLAHAEAEVARA
jgi:G3E family GTPase